jgi:hypothetical protein
LLVVEEDVLEPWKIVEQSRPVNAEAIAVQVVFRPHRPGDRISVVPQLRSL